MRINFRNIIDLSETYKVGEELVGKKAHELGMIWKLGIPLPNGFVISTQFHKEFLHLTGIDKEIKKTQILKHPALSDSVDKLFQPVRKKIMQSYISQNLASELHKFYRHFSGIFKNRSLNVFSSSSNNKSIMFPDVKGDANLVLKIKTIWSLSLEEPVAIVLQENINSGIKGKITTNSPAIDKKLTELQMNKLIGYCKIIQKHFYFPYEIEYAIKKDKIFITQINPFTGVVDSSLKKLSHQFNKVKKALIKGVSINPGIVTGHVRILNKFHVNAKMRKGEIIVISNLNASLCKKIKYAKGVIIDSILPNSLDKTLYRKNFQIPTIEGVKNASKIFQNGNVVTVNGMNGEIYSGGLVN